MYGPPRSADLFAELNRLQNFMDQVLGGAESSPIRRQSGAGFPIINIGATPETFEVMALAPGLDPAALQVTADRGLLIIAGDRPSAVPQPQPQEAGAQGVSVYAQERFAGSFRRVISLPQDADPARIDARYRDGILYISVAKRESSRPRRIDVN